MTLICINENTIFWDLLMLIPTTARIYVMFILLVIAISLIHSLNSYLDYLKKNKVDNPT